MKSKVKKIVASSMVLCMSLLPSVASANEAVNHWGTLGIQEHVQKAYMGSNGGELQPDHVMSRAEFVAMLNSMMELTEHSDRITQFEDVSPSDWYYDEFSKALAAGYVGGTSSTTLSPTKELPGEQGLVMIGRVLQLDEGDASIIDQYEGGDQIPSYAKGMISALIANGYIVVEGGNLLEVTENFTLAVCFVVLSALGTREIQ